MKTISLKIILGLLLSTLVLFSNDVNITKTINMSPIISYLLSDTYAPTFHEIAINKIKAYADNQSQPVPTVQDYSDAGVTGVTEENLATINSEIAAKSSSDVDTMEEIQEIVSITIDILENMSLRLTDQDFNSYSDISKLKIADKLLATLFFGYPLDQLESAIINGNFLTTIESKLNSETNQTQIDEIETYINDENIFGYDVAQQEGRRPITKMLVRFYAMKTLNDYYLKHWIAYTLTQTIMFSPSYALVGSVTSDDVINTYNSIVDINNTYNGNIRELTQAHIKSESNWRRFRSPEDNGREIMEIFLLDTDDTHVPIAAQALQNWKLTQGSDGLYRLDLSGEENSEPLDLFNTTITNGESFYSALVDSEGFLTGVTTRLVDYFLPRATPLQKNDLIYHIVNKSKPTTWKALIFDIIFSKIYLLETEKILSPEELFYSFAKKTNFTHDYRFFEFFHTELIAMNYAPMKAKLGKVNGIGLDTSSLAEEHSYFYRWILTRFHEQNYLNFDITDTARRLGINLNLIDYQNFGWIPSQENYDNYYGGTGVNDTGKYEISVSFIQYLFKVTIRREALQEEIDQIMYDLKDHNSERYLKVMFDMFKYPREINDSERLGRQTLFAALALNYIARLTEMYIYEKVER